MQAPDIRKGFYENAGYTLNEVGLCIEDSKIIRSMIDVSHIFPEAGKIRGTRSRTLLNVKEKDTENNVAFLVYGTPSDVIDFVNNKSDMTVQRLDSGHEFKLLDALMKPMETLEEFDIPWNASP